MTDWNNYIMRKFGQTIRRNILDCSYPYVYGVALIVVEKEISKKIDALIDHLPDSKWSKS